MKWNESLLEKNISQPKINGHGTKIYIHELRDRWTQNRIKNLSRYLSTTYNDNVMNIVIKPEQDDQVKYIFRRYSGDN